MKNATLLTLCASAILLALSASTALAGRPVGAIVRTPTDDKLYIMVPVGKKAHIPTVMVLRCLKLENRTPTVIPQAEINSYPQSPLLLKSPGGLIYLIEGSKKRHIASPAVFQRENFDPASVLPMMDDQLYCIEDGAPLN